MKVANIYVYGDIDNAPADMAAEFGIVSLDSVHKQVQDAGEFDKVVVHIHSRGGSVTEGFAIHDYLKSLGKPVETMIEGLCASIATVIALAGSVRLMTPNSTFFIHNPWTGIEGDADKFEQVANDLKQTEDNLATFYSKITGQDFNKIKELMKDETSMTADAAIQLGFITKVSEPVKAYAKVKLTHENKMSKLESKSVLQRLKNFIAGEQKAAMMETDNGTLHIKGDAPEQGMAVYSDEAMNTPAADGTYTLNDGTVLNVVEGKIAEITAPQASATVEELQAKIVELEKANAEKDEMLQQINDKIESGEVVMARKGNPAAQPFNRNKPAVKSVVDEMKERREQAKTTNKGFTAKTDK